MANSSTETRASILSDFLTKLAIEKPDKPFCIFLAEDEKTEITLSYSQVDQSARKVAAWLQQKINPGDRILLIYPTSPDYLITILGCLYAGAVVVPVYTPRDAAGIQNLARVAVDADASLILSKSVDADRIHKLAALPDQLASIRWLTTDDLSDEDLSLTWQPPAISADSLAFIMYTSGSTRAPAGVELSHGNLRQALLDMQNGFHLHSQDRGLSWAPFSHISGLFSSVLCPIYLEIPEIILTPEFFSSNPMSWLRAISRHRVSTSGAPNFALDLCASLATAEDKANLDLSSWRIVANGAEPVRASTLEKFTAAFSGCGFNPAAMTAVYGLTEAPMVSFFDRKSGKSKITISRNASQDNRVTVLTTGDPDGLDVVSCGVSVPATKIAIVDPIKLLRCSEDQIGEIWVSGPIVSHGYWKKPVETENIFRARLSDTGDGPFLRTGDLGFIHGGNLFITGRYKDMIILYGRNYYPTDIEVISEKAHPAIQQGTSAAFSISINGEEKVVVILEHRKDIPDPDVEEIARAVRLSIAREMHLPVEAVVIAAPGSIPRTGIGKVQRFKCRDAYLSGQMPNVGISHLSQSSETAKAKSIAEPLNPIEQEICFVFAEVLHLDKIQPNDNFFSMGGNSLLGTQAVSRICERFKVSLQPQLLFEFPTPVEFAAHLESVIRNSDANLLPPIQVVDRAQPLELSFSQERMWFVQQLDPNNSAYNIPLAYRFNGKADQAVLQKTLDWMIARHEILRTYFVFKDEQPLQIIVPSLSVNFEKIDLAAGDAKANLTEWVNRESARPFDLSVLPLIRAAVLDLGNDENVLCITMHHIITDAWATGLFLQEFQSAYELFSQGREPQIPPPEIQYADFAVWQRKWLTGQVLVNESAYWREQLAGVPALELFTDFKRPIVQTFRGSQVMADLPADLYDALIQLSSKSGTSVFMAALSAFYVLLYQYSGQVDLSVGVPIANRKWLAVENLLGTLVNTLVLRTSLDGNPTLGELLSRVRDVSLGAYAHQDMPFESLVAELRLPRDISRSPIFQVMFNVINVPTVNVDREEFKDSYVEVDTSGAQFDLTLTLVDTPILRRVILNYNTDLFERSTVVRMLNQYMALLGTVAARLEQRLLELPMLTDTDRQLVLVDWNNTAQDYPRSATVQSLFEMQVKRSPERVAASDEERQITYLELDRRTNQLAQYLRDQGVGVETLVGLCLPRGIDMLVSLLAILKAGGAYVPLDPSFPSERLSYMLENSGAPILLTQSAQLHLFSSNNLKLVCLDKEASSIDSLSAQPLLPVSHAENLAYVIYTSGSTGRPKGVQVLQRGLVNFLSSMQHEPGLTEEDILLSVTSLSFDIAGMELYLPLISGAQVKLVSSETAADGFRLMKAMQESGATIMQATPATWKLLISSGWNGDRRLKILCGGEALPPDLAAGLLSRCGSLWNMYGPTETTIWSTLLQITSPTQLITIGRPIANTQVFILDTGRNPVPIGRTGEIYIGGDGLARGYLNLPALTAEKFVPNPFDFSGNSRLYRTGDLGRFLPGGQIEFLGRIDNQVKLRGYRIELGEIEQVIQESSLVKDVVVIPRSNGSSDEHLVGYLVRQPNSEIDLPALRDKLKQKLPAYMIPAAFVILDQLPLTPNGKIDRRSLPEPEATSIDAGGYVPPENDIEITLVQIWERLLNVQPIGVTQSFFDLGGHSLLAARLFAEIHNRFGKVLPLTTIFEEPTIRHLASVIISQKDGSNWPVLVPMQPKGRKPPLFFVHPFGGDVIGFKRWSEHLGLDQPFYGLRARGLDGIQEPLGSIEEMATLYNAEIRKIQPHGPYKIGGFCIGGVVAFEMAQQLLRQGEKIDLLAIVNQPPPNSDYYSFKLSRKSLSAFFDNLPEWSRDFFQLRWEEMWLRISITGAALRTWLGFKMRTPKTIKTPPAGVSARAIRTRTARIPEYQRETITNYELNFNNALDKYYPQSYPGKITLFRTPRQPLICSFDDSLCWAPLAGGGLEIRSVPGSNTTLTTDPHASEFSRALSEFLD
ncbi:MAG TPA: amino acid adenylation domain-containing protein [Longilinea sp.]|nr:amino acid adenylation domain-containing protein [Longilinea sp.]